MVDMATFGTVEMYDELAQLLNNDPEWLDKAKAISYAMAFEYNQPVGKTFFFRFEEGVIQDVKEVASLDAEPTDFALSADPETWRGVFEGKVRPVIAVTRGKIKLQGSMGTLMKHMAAFNILLDSMKKVKLT